MSFLAKSLANANISVIIPTKNEIEGIEYVVSGARKVVGDRGELIIVDEKSSDGTVEKARLTDSNVKVFQRDGTGKGSGIKKAVKVFTGDIFVILDSDAQFDPLDIPKVVQPILSGEADVVLGSRITGKREKGSMNLLHYLGNRLINLTLSVLYQKWITDSQTGLRAMRSDVVRSIDIVSDGFAIEAELTAKCLDSGYKVVEVPINFYCRKGRSRSKLKAFSDGKIIFKAILFS